MASKVTGFKETARALRKVAAFPKKAVSGASRKALKPMLAATKSNLKSQGSYHRGVLYRSLKIRQLASTSALSEWAITPTGRGVGIAHLVEAPVAPHFQPKRGRMHPGHPGYPFMEPAFFAHADEAVQIMTREMGAGLISYASQVAYRGR
jgi:hypothetical protein